MSDMKVFRKAAVELAGGKLEPEQIDLIMNELLRGSKPSEVDRALARLCASGIPGLMAAVETEELPALLTAIGPKLTLQQLDESCSKLEDLAILVLGAARAARHEIAEAIDGCSPKSLAAKTYGEAAIDLLEDLGRGDREWLDLAPEEVRENLKLARSVTGKSEPNGGKKRKAATN